MSSGTHHVATYPTVAQYERWERRSEDLDYTTFSQFVQDMVEAGIKADLGFDAGVQPDEPVQELRQQRNDLRQELEHARERIQNLEERVYYSERATVTRFLEDNPGASYEDVLAHMKATLPERMTQYLDGVYTDFWIDGNGERHEGFFATIDGAEEM